MGMGEKGEEGGRRREGQRQWQQRDKGRARRPHPGKDNRRGEASLPPRSAVRALGRVVRPSLGKDDRRGEAPLPPRSADRALGRVVRPSLGKDDRRGEASLPPRSADRALGRVARKGGRLGGSCRLELQRS